MRTKYVVTAVPWLVSLFAVNAWARGQSREFVHAPEPVIVSGRDLGFRVEGHIAGEPAGTIVIRVSGEWVEAREAPGQVRFLGKPTE